MGFACGVLIPFEKSNGEMATRPCTHESRRKALSCSNRTTEIDGINKIIGNMVKRNNAMKAITKKAKAETKDTKKEIEKIQEEVAKLQADLEKTKAMAQAAREAAEAEVAALEAEDVPADTPGGTEKTAETPAAE